MAQLPLAESPSRFVLAVALVVLGCQVFGAVARRLNQPAVLGEISGGLIWGPAVLGLLWPVAQGWLFPPTVVAAIHAAAELGVVCFGFLLGSELRFEHVVSRSGTVALVVVGATALPFLVGASIGWAGHGVLGGSGPAPAHIAFVGLAMSVTALPVLARILIDLGLASTQLGTLALTSAAIGDAIIWIALTFVMSAAQADSGRADPVVTLSLTGALVLLVVGLVRPALGRVAVRYESRRAGSTHLPALLVAGALFAAATTQLIGLHPVIGAFLFGLAIPSGSAVAGRVHSLVSGFTISLLLPLFFASVGLRLTAAGGLVGHWLLFVVIVLAAVGTKLLGAGAGARLAGVPTRNAVQLGVLMSCRGVTELVVLAIGYEHGLLSAAGYALLVLMALVTTAVTGPLLWLTGVGRSAHAGGAARDPR